MIVINYRDYAWGEIDGDDYLFDSSRGAYYYLNQVAKEIWIIITEHNTHSINKEKLISEVADEMMLRYTCTYEKIYRDIVSLVDQLMKIGIIREED